MASRCDLNVENNVRPIVFPTKATGLHRYYTLAATKVPSYPKTLRLVARRSKRPIPRLNVIKKQVSEGSRLARRNQIGSSLVNLTIYQGGANPISNGSGVLLRRIRVVSSLIVKALRRNKMSTSCQRRSLTNGTHYGNRDVLLYRTRVGRALKINIYGRLRAHAVLRYNHSNASLLIFHTLLIRGVTRRHQRELLKDRLEIQSTISRVGNQGAIRIAKITLDQNVTLTFLNRSVRRVKTKLPISVTRSPFGLQLVIAVGEAVVIRTRVLGRNQVVRYPTRRNLTILSHEFRQ